MYDCAIIGSGPAGLSAAINLKQRGKDLIWFGNAALSAKVEKSEKIANYPGLGLITGAELNARFAEHAAALGISVEDKMVTTILPGDGSYSLLANNEVYEARTILLAIGAGISKGYPGEAEYLGRGVSYCATCDGFLYKGKTIAVFCGSQRYEHEVKFLAELAGKVWLHTPYKADAALPGNVERLAAPIREVRGGLRVTELLLTDGSTVPVDGLFCLRDAVAPSTLLPGLAIDGPHIVVDRECKTNLPGCFAARDCTGRPYQIAKAVGEGNIAAHSVLEYLG